MRESSSLRKNKGTQTELIVFAAILFALNIPLAMGGFADSFIFLPDRVAAGEWWRVLTHPFVHLTWYHFLLDAGAFLVLHGSIEEPKRLKRLAYVAACGIGSLGLSVLASPVAHAQGLCGLSGIAHGLMAVSALESATSDTLAGKPCRAGVITFGIVVAKSIIEVLSGRVFFELLHFGMMGIPIPESHAGGVFSGIAAFLALHWSSRIEPTQVVHSRSP